jgi:hypothetical protein
MAWEQRKGRAYYYRKVWQDGTCRSEYVGRGRTAGLISEIEQLRQESHTQERGERQIARNEFAELAATPEALVLLLERARSEVARALEAAGYHQHKRQWRKQRAKKES